MLIQAEGEDEENWSGKLMGLRLEANLSGNSGSFWFSVPLYDIF